jgi:hypothetical protein
MLYCQLISMTTIAQNIKKMAVRFCLILLFIPGSLSLCQAQGVAGAGQISGLDVPGPVPIQSSAPALSGWAASDVADMGTSIGVSQEMALNSVPSIVAPATPVPALTVPGPIPIQSSAPALNGWVASVGAEMGTSIGVSDEMVLANYVPAVFAHETPVTGQTFTPAISSPEPSTLSLLPAGSAALLRFGWRKRSN